MQTHLLKSNFYGPKFAIFKHFKTNFLKGITWRKLKGGSIFKFLLGVAVLEVLFYIFKRDVTLSASSVIAPKRGALG